MPKKPTVAVYEDVLLRARGEYLEMPGLRLTEQQARRLWGLDARTCAHVLEALTEARFLYRRDDGTYVLVGDHRTPWVRRPT